MGAGLCLSLLAAATNPGPPDPAQFEVRYIRNGANALVGRVWVEKLKNGDCTEHWVLKKEGEFQGILPEPNPYRVVPIPGQAKPANVSAFVQGFMGSLPGKNTVSYIEHNVSTYTTNACAELNANANQCAWSAPPPYAHNTCPMSSSMVRSPPPATGGGGRVAVGVVDRTEPPAVNEDDDRVRVQLKQVDTGTTMVSVSGSHQAFAVITAATGGGKDENWLFKDSSSLVNHSACYSDPGADPPSFQAFVNCGCKWLGAGSDMVYVKLHAKDPVTHTEP